MKTTIRTSSNSKKFPDQLKLSDAGMRGNSRCFKLSRRFRYRSSKGLIEVPKNFITDGASIPQVFWSIFSPFGKYFAAAVIHDYLYSVVSTYNFTRREIDLIFKEAMFNDGVDWATREIVYRAVQCFGWAAFKRVKKEPVIGEDDIEEDDDES